MATITEDFEDTSYVVTWTGSDWFRSTANSHSGNWSLSNEGQFLTTLEVSFDIPPGAVSARFWYFVPYLAVGEVEVNVLADSTQLFSITEDQVWAQTPVLNVEGRQRLRVRYTVDIDEDVMFIDDLTFTTIDSIDNGWGPLPAF